MHIVSRMEDTLSATHVEQLAFEAGLSVKELCERAHISHTTFYRWRAGKTAPGLAVYQRIIEAVREAGAG